MVGLGKAKEYGLRPTLKKSVNKFNANVNGMLNQENRLLFGKTFRTFALSNNEGYSSNNKQFKIMESVVANAWVETYQNFMNLVYNGLDTHEKISSYLHQMNLFATEGKVLLHKGFLTTLKEKNALAFFVDCFLEEISMFADNGLPSESPFAISEQELKDKHELIIDSIREISSAFCNFLNKMEHFDDDQPTTTELKQRMKAFLIVDRALLLEIDKE